MGNFSATILPDSINQSGFTKISKEIQNDLFSVTLENSTLFSFSICQGEKFLFLLVNEAYAIMDEQLRLLSATIEKVSAYRSQRFEILPEAKQQNSLVINKILLEASTNKAKYVALFKIDMKPFVKFYMDKYEDRVAAGISRDAFSAICTCIQATGTLYALAGGKAAAAMFSKTHHDAELFSEQVYAVFCRITGCLEKNKPSFGPFADFSVDDPETKQDLRDFLDQVQD